MRPIIPHILNRLVCKVLKPHVPNQFITDGQIYPRAGKFAEQTLVVAASLSVTFDGNYDVDNDDDDDDDDDDDGDDGDDDDDERRLEVCCSQSR